MSRYFLLHINIYALDLVDERFDKFCDFYRIFKNWRSGQDWDPYIDPLPQFCGSADPDFWITHPDPGANYDPAEFISGSYLYIFFLATEK